MKDLDVRSVIRASATLALGRSLKKRLVPVGVSNRHAHLCQQDLELLFGVGYELQPIKALSQPGQFVARETITLEGPKGSLEKIRVLGPIRAETQIEISISDSYGLGIDSIVRMSGDLSGSPGGKLISGGSFVLLKQGVIVAARHLHVSKKQAEALNLKDGERICVRSRGPRSIILENILVRSGRGNELELHLDRDEANAAMLQTGDVVEIL